LSAPEKFLEGIADEAEANKVAQALLNAEE
jgi:hypothetical protein